MDNAHSEKDIKFCRNLRLYVLSYVDEMCSRGIDLSFFYKNRVEILDNTRIFLSNPDTDIAKYLSLLSITIDARHSKKTKANHFSSVSFFSFFKILLYFLFNLKRDTYFWPEASAKLSNPVVSWLMIKLLKIKHRYKGDKLVRDDNCQY